MEKRGIGFILFCRSVPMSLSSLGHLWTMAGILPVTGTGAARVGISTDCYSSVNVHTLAFRQL